MPNENEILTEPNESDLLNDVDLLKKEAVREHYARIGRKGGKRSKGGGRPPIPDHLLTPQQRKNRQKYINRKRKLAANR